MYFIGVFQKQMEKGVECQAHKIKSNDKRHESIGQKFLRFTRQKAYESN